MCICVCYDLHNSCMSYNLIPWGMSVHVCVHKCMPMCLPVCVLYDVCAFSVFLYFMCVLQSGYIHVCMFCLNLLICVCVHAYSCMQASVPTCMYYDLCIPCVCVCVCVFAQVQWEIYFKQLAHVTSTLAGGLGWKPWKS